MSAKLKRFDFELIEHRSQVPGWPGSYEWELQEKPDGSYVLFSEAQALNAELLEALEALESAFMAHTSWNGEPPQEIIKARALIAKARQ